MESRYRAKIKKLALNFVGPVVVIIILFNIKMIAGFTGLIIYLLVLLYKNLSLIFELQGRFKYSKGNIKGGLEYLRKAYVKDKNRIKTGTLYGYLLLKNGYLEQAEIILRELLAVKMKKEDKALIESNYALVLWKKGMLDEAIELLRKVIDEYRTTTVYGSLGYLLVLKGDYSQALQFNLEAYTYNDADNVILDNLGQTYELGGENEKAAEIYEKLMLKQPLFPEAYYNNSLVLLQLGKKEEALQNLKKALDYPFTFLSTIAKEDIIGKIEALEAQ